MEPRRRHPLSPATLAEGNGNEQTTGNNVNNIKTVERNEMISSQHYTESIRQRSRSATRSAAHNACETRLRNSTSTILNDDIIEETFKRNGRNSCRIQKHHLHVQRKLTNSVPERQQSLHIETNKVYDLLRDSNQTVKLTRSTSDNRSNSLVISSDPQQVSNPRYLVGASPSSRKRRFKDREARAQNTFGACIQSSTPIAKEYIELEEEPHFSGTLSATAVPDSSRAHTAREEIDLLDIDYDPVHTSSGVNLTHRHVPTSVAPKHHIAESVATSSSPSNFFPSRPSAEPFGSRHKTPLSLQIENMITRATDTDGFARQKRLLAYARLWTCVLFATILIGTCAVASTVHHESKSGQQTSDNNVAVESPILLKAEPIGERQVPTVEAPSASSKATEQNSVRQLVPPLGSIGKDENEETPHEKHGIMEGLREEFNAWVKKHKRNYGTLQETEKRFKIWIDNHHRTIKKNKEHGPCKLTNKAVFGDNHFKDLTTEEFKERFLTGYKGPLMEEFEEEPILGSANERYVRRKFHAEDELNAENEPHQPRKMIRMEKVLDPLRSGDPRSAVEKHPDVEERFLEHWEQTSMPLGKTYINNWVDHKKEVCSGAKTKTYIQRDTSNKRRCRKYYSNPVYSSSGYGSSSCSWWDFSCWLRYMFSGSMFGGTMEPGYDANSYPTAIDWRDYGVVSSVHSQGNCGACWAITAVETIESAYAIKSGTLVDLGEAEVIACDDTCEMCDGGWPQNAYDYVKQNNGLPPEQYCSYDGDFLEAMTMYKTGQGDSLSYYDVEGYLAATCPSGDGGGGNSHSGSGDEQGQQNQYSTYDSSIPRYGKIKGYGYSTERCICYTDGTGCDCDEQNEKMAVMNVASYGPATVCLEASTWQDYAGGIMTSAIGCSQAFLDMNHCVQVVGYAYMDVSNGGGAGVEENDRSGSGSGSGGSQDDSERQGYWIVRNQWSSYWGMNGYAYVAMGDNTCGILNDMTQVYM